MAQLYIQKNAQPDTWVMSGAPTATTVFLSLDAAINYSDGTSDTLPANTLAVLPDTTTVFDRTHDVFVCYTVQTSRVLSVIKESLLPTLTSAYAPLCRIELHGIRPYQPEPYLAAGGGGTAPPLGTTFYSALGAKALDLWNGSANNAPPTGWQTPGFDDSGWAAATLAHSAYAVAAGDAPVAGSAALWSSVSPDATSIAAGLGGQTLVRQHVVLSGAPILGATLECASDESMTVYVNGTLLGTQSFPAQPTRTFPVPAGVLLPGQDNLIAVLGGDNPTFVPGNAVDDAWVSFALAVEQGSGGGVPLPGGAAEGDLLVYRSGAWVRMAIGTSGQELTVVAGDPAWATPAASGVTSIAVAAPSPLLSGGGPITSSGTITLSWAGGQTANRVLASPDGASGAVSLRALVGSDIPVDASTIVVASGTIKGNYQAGSGIGISGNTISATGGGGTVTSVALTVPGFLSLSGSPITTSGTFAVGLANASANTVFAGPGSGSAAAPTFRALGAADLPAAAAAGGHIHAHGHFI